VVALWARGAGRVALAAAVVLVRAVGAPVGTVPLLLVMLFLAWEYSAPAAATSFARLGELTTAVVVTLSTPLFAFYLQAGAILAAAVSGRAPVVRFQFAMAAGHRISRRHRDAAAGKRTLWCAWARRARRRFTNA